MNDIELLQLIKTAPERGQRAFYDKYFNYVYTIVYAKLKLYAKPEDIDECVGDVFSAVDGVKVEELCLESVGRIVVDGCAQEDDAVHHES